MPSKKKTTFNPRPEVIAALDEALAQGAPPSKNALVERALLKELNDLRKQARRLPWQEAAKDPLLLKDVNDVEATFRCAVVE